MHDARRSSLAATRSSTNAPAWISASLIVVVGVGTLLAEAGEITALRPLTRAGVLLWFAANLPRLRGVEMVFVAVAAAVVPAVVAFAPDPWRALLEGLDRAGLFLTFVATLNLLRDAAQTSAAVRRAGLFLVSQSPPRRYAALTLGCHLFTIALNMGALILLGAMVRRSNTLAAAAGDAVIVAIREQRMTTALLRGFGTTLMWAPTGVSVGYTLSLVPALTWFDVAPAAIGLAATWLVLGWIIDRLQWPPSARRAALPPPAYVSPLETLPMLGITALLLLSVILAKVAFGSSLLVAVLATVPFVAVVWLVLQYRRFGAGRAIAVTGRRLRRHILDLMPQTRPESVVLAAAAFMGVGFSALVEAGGISAWLSQLGLHPALIAILAFLLILALAQIAITPLVTATIVGTTIMQMTPMPVPPLALALALQGGWVLASMTSPYTGGMLTLARVIGKKPIVLQRWNAIYGLACSVTLALIYGIWLS
jgi:hypothetical protein